ncbi:hypothetical protein [uncultured Alistipes sp.]|uniref:hypothetical protein n=1 Tax=uncultured Alistipes sp. TaxID=538949 RepID=UPI002627227C|nr:hypothetical protein [uncultured Alistipes sp.]
MLLLRRNTPQSRKVTHYLTKNKKKKLFRPEALVEKSGFFDDRSFFAVERSSFFDFLLSRMKAVFRQARQTPRPFKTSASVSLYPSARSFRKTAGRAPEPF